MEEIIKRYGGYTLLELCGDGYEEYARSHNEQLISSLTDPTIYVNDGFDLFTTEEIECFGTTKIDFRVRIQTRHIDTHNIPCGMKLYPRSSIYKTPLRLANSVGVIDPGYRGNIMGVFDCATPTTIQKGTRLVQLCANSNLPIYVKLISVDELTLTNRGENGFGSSGI
jgi:dUTP pyrophosphatase